ncbi:MAG: hypothetical protein J0L55_15000 [Caulobacterales bacterium]|nr:hypothetical protein [Caulobacterales bacterium]
MKNLSRRQMVSALGLGIGAPLFLNGCGKKTNTNGVLRVALRGGPDSLDPFRAEFAISALLFRQYFLPLVGYGKDGIASPDLAIAEKWTPNNDYTQWTFQIKPNLKFSDNSPLGPQEVLNSFYHAANWKTAYPDAPEIFGIKGFKKAFLEKLDPKTIAVHIISNNEIQIDLDGADAAFPERMQEFYPVPVHIIEKFGEQWTNVEKIVVSGPFIPKIYTQTRLRFEKNELGGWSSQMPQAIEIEAVDDASTRIRLFQSGDVDLAQDPSLLRFAGLQKEYGDSFKRYKAPALIYLSFNTKRPQFTNIDIRYALSLAFDRTKVSHNILRDAVEPATRFVRSEPQIIADKAKAKAIMEKNGFTLANPLRFELIVAKDERERAAIEMINQWKEIGVEAIITTVESSAISARLNGFDFDCAIVRIDKGMKSDPLDLMGSFADGGNAYSHQWKNSNFDVALEKARAIGEPAARKAALIAAEKFMLEEVPIMPIWFSDSAWLQNKRVIGGIEGMAPIIWPKLSLKE